MVVSTFGLHNSRESKSVMTYHKQPRTLADSLTAVTQHEKVT
jgi:hypothetical protein